MQPTPQGFLRKLSESIDGDLVESVALGGKIIADMVGLAVEHRRNKPIPEQCYLFFLFFCHFSQISLLFESGGPISILEAFDLTENAKLWWDV